MRRLSPREGELPHSPPTCPVPHPAALAVFAWPPRPFSVWHSAAWGASARLRAWCAIKA